MSVTTPAASPADSAPDDSAPDDTADRPTDDRPAGRGLAASSTAIRARLGRGWQSTRRLTGDWLDRPMTSLHLVLGIFALMLGFGLLMVLSSSSVVAFRNGGSSFSVFANQATYAAIGLVCFCAAQFLPVRLMRSMSTIAVIVSLVLLVAVLIDPIGAKINGARSWIRIAGFQFQPSEIAKLALLLWMGHVLAARRSTLRSLKSLLIPVLPVFVLMAGLIMLQPDLGTTVALTIVFMAVMFFAGAPWWTFAGLGTLGVVAFFYLALTAEYRMARLLSFIDPEAHPDSSYQLLQSLYGMGNGGWFGVGLGQSRAKWSYLPNADSDFIFAIIGEELGLIGTLVLLLLFALLAYTGLRIARRNVDPFVKIVASAGTVWLVGQAAINIGYVVGLLPVTGIPLPMISSGGTSLLITMVVFGLLANFARREPQAAAALQAGGGGRLARFLGIKHTESTGKSSLTSRRRRPPTTPAEPGSTRPATGRIRPRLHGSSPAPRTSARRGAARPDAGRRDSRGAASQPARTGRPVPDDRRSNGSDPRSAPPSSVRVSGSQPRRATQPTSSRSPAGQPRPGQPRSTGQPRSGQPRSGQPQPGQPQSGGRPRSDDTQAGRGRPVQRQGQPAGAKPARKGLFGRRGGA